MGQKLRKLQIADFEQIWDFFPVFLIPGCQFHFSSHPSQEVVSGRDCVHQTSSVLFDSQRRRVFVLLTQQILKTKKIYHQAIQKQTFPIVNIMRFCFQP